MSQFISFPRHPNGLDLGTSSSRINTDKPLQVLTAILFGVFFFFFLNIMFNVYTQPFGYNRPTLFLALIPGAFSLAPVLFMEAHRCPVFNLL